MLINLTLFYLTSSNFSPSPLISGPIPNLIIQNSYVSKSFSHFAYLSKINQIKTYSSHFSFFLDTPFIISNDVITYGRAWTCFLIRKMDIQEEDLRLVLFSLCVFENTKNFVSTSNLDFVSISKSVFQNGNGQKYGLEIKDCKELYISKTVFLNCDYTDSLIYAPKLPNITFQNCEVKECNCGNYIFHVSNTMIDCKINFNNFIDIPKCIFSKSNPITISYCYFKNVEYIMECTNTPMGCLSSVKIIDCSYEGQLPKGYTGSFNNDNNPTTIYIDTFETSDCNFQEFREYTTIPPRSTIPPTDTPSFSPTESPEPTQTPKPTNTPQLYPSESPTASASPNATASPTPTVSPNATETPTASASVSATESPTATASVSESPTPTRSPPQTPTESPTPYPTNTPKATPTETPTETPTASPGPTKAKFPVIYIILIIVIIIVVIIIIILIICCVRKCLDMKQENLLDRGLMLRYDTDENSETTSDRSNALNIQSDSIESDNNSDDDNEGDFFSNKLRNRNKFINQNNEANENASSSSI